MPDRLQRRLAEIGAPADVCELVAELAEQAVRDPLTGLTNRRFFDEALAQQIETARRYNRPLSLVLFDLDRFKEVNDTFGHEAGDTVLKSFAQLLSKTARKADIVCRIGGDEFAVLLPETEISKAWKMIDRFFQCLEDSTATAAGRGWPAKGRTATTTESGNVRQCTQIESPPAEGCPKGGVGFPRIASPFGRCPASAGPLSLCSSGENDSNYWKLSASAGAAALPSDNLFAAADAELLAAKREKNSK